jgi:hypothetical protein
MWSLRKVHGIIALYGCVSLVLTTVTGILYAVLKAWSDLDRKQLKILLQLHQMSIIGIKRYYVVLLGLSVIVQTISGGVMLWRRYKRVGNEILFGFQSLRGIHTVLSLVLGGLFLFLMGVSGLMYRLNKNWLGRPEAAGFWMELHIGKVFMSNYWPWYPLLVGMFSLALIVSGTYLVPAIRKLFRK